MPAVGRRSSRSDGDVARSRQFAGTASPSSELADAGFANAMMLIRGRSSVTFCPYNVRRHADGLSCTNTLSDGGVVLAFVTTPSASSAADNGTASDSTPVLPTLHVVGASVVYSAIPDECRVSSDVVAGYNCCWTGLPTPRRRAVLDAACVVDLSALTLKNTIYRSYRVSCSTTNSALGRQDVSDVERNETMSGG